MKYNRIILSVLFIGFSILLSSCEDEIDVDLDEGKSQLIVDGFITNDSSSQSIRLTLSAPYFYNAPTPAVSDAQVRVIGPAATYNFNYDQNGNYVYDPQSMGALDSIGFPYKLEIDYGNSLYTSIQSLQPVPTIDSMIQVFEEGTSFNEEGYFPEFFARDFAGREDWYWIKAFKNGERIYEDPTNLILSKDAGFMGAEADGFNFIVPIRAAITNPDDPFQVGDFSSVELLSMNQDAFKFLQQAILEANNGGLFSTPPSNIKSNIKDAAGNSQNEVLGVFSLSGISKSSLTLTQQQ
jgi:hypothetical protein